MIADPARGHPPAAPRGCAADRRPRARVAVTMDIALRASQPPRTAGRPASLRRHPSHCPEPAHLPQHPLALPRAGASPPAHPRAARSRTPRRNMPREGRRGEFGGERITLPGTDGSTLRAAEACLSGFVDAAIERTSTSPAGRPGTAAIPGRPAPPDREAASEMTAPGSTPSRTGRVAASAMPRSGNGVGGRSGNRRHRAGAERCRRRPRLRCRHR